MARNPEVITIDGHQLQRMEKPAKHGYYCKGCKEIDVRPCYKHENYHLHKECYESCTTHSIMFSLSGSKSNCDFLFHKEALGGKGVCDACGDDVKGWFYKCKICKKPHYLHPCCAKLPIKKYVDNREEKIIIDLIAKSPSNCLICRKKENSDGFSGWYYISRCHNYCYHWSCMKHMALKECKKDDDQCGKGRIHKPGMSNQALKTMTQKPATLQHPNHAKQKQDYVREKRSEALPTRDRDLDKKPRQGTKNKDNKRHPHVKGIIRFTVEVAVELLNIFIPLIFGLPPLPLGLVLKLLK